MTHALLVLLALVVLVALAFGTIRLEQARKRRAEGHRWAQIASALGAQLSVGEDGRPRIEGRSGEIGWDVRASGTPEQISLFAVHFDGADRLAPAMVWRSADPEIPIDRPSERASDFKLIFLVEEPAPPAGCVRWVEDAQVRDLLMTLHPVGVRVDSGSGARPRMAIELAMDQMDPLLLGAAIDWARRMAELARDGTPATPPH